MKRDRVFVFGDSFAFNYFSYKENLVNAIPHFGSGAVNSYVGYYNYFGHWIDHLEKFRDVYSFAKGAASNESIIYQIGNLQNYKYRSGDRVIVIFSSPERLSIVLRKTKYDLAIGGELYKNLLREPSIISFVENQYLERSNRWDDNTIVKDEKKFIDLLKSLLAKWNPIFFTWTPTLGIKSVEEIPFSPFDYSIFKASSGLCNDWHLGVEGNYKLFKLFADKLNINTLEYSFSYKPYRQNLV